MAAHRQDRPWSGERLGATQADAPAYDATCYLCPGNARVGGAVNPDYAQTFVFDNDLPCVGLHAPTQLAAPAGIYRNRPAVGIARVVCYSRQHNQTLAELPVEQVDALLRVWQEEYIALGERPEINHVLAFENKGEVVGVSNPHPHGQIYATNFVFKTIAIEDQVCRRHHRDTGRVLFQDILDAEHTDGRRILSENDSAVAFVPYFARYAYEVYVAPKQTHAGISGMSDRERCDLAAILKDTLIRLDNLWQMSFPYVMCLHQAPTDGEDHSTFHFHIEFHPPLRKPNLRKHLAGPEIGGGSFLSDTSPEDKAAELRALPATHYRLNR